MEEQLYIKVNAVRDGIMIRWRSFEVYYVNGASKLATDFINKDNDMFHEDGEYYMKVNYLIPKYMPMYSLKDNEFIKYNILVVDNFIEADEDDII